MKFPCRRAPPRRPVRRWNDPPKLLRMVSLDAPRIAKAQLPRVAPPFLTSPPSSPRRTATFCRGACSGMACYRRSALRSVLLLAASRVRAATMFVRLPCRSPLCPPCGAPPRQRVNVQIELDSPPSWLVSCCLRTPVVSVALGPSSRGAPSFKSAVPLRLRVACAMRAGMRNGTAQTVGSALHGDL